MTEEEKYKKQKNAKCPFANSNKTPCPIVNSFINMGELDPNREWTKKDITNVLIKIKFSNKLSRFLASVFIYLGGGKTLSVKRLQIHNLMEHDVSLSREDYYLGDHIHYNKKRFRLIRKYFKNKKNITLKELIEYMNHLYKKSKKNNSQFYFKTAPQLLVLLAEMCGIFLLLSENNRLNLDKLEKVFENETLENIETNNINLGQFVSSFSKSFIYWINASIMN